jgi:hypothetical protein
LVWQFLAGAIQDALPDFGRAERHDATAYSFYVEKSNERDAERFSWLELSPMLG